MSTTPVVQPPQAVTSTNPRRDGRPTVRASMCHLRRQMSVIISDCLEQWCSHPPRSNWLDRLPSVSWRRHPSDCSCLPWACLPRLPNSGPQASSRDRLLLNLAASAEAGSTNGPLTRAGWSRLPCVFETDSPGTSNGGKSRPGVLRPRALDRHTADRQSSLTPKIPIQNDYGPLRARKLRDTPRAVPRWRASWASRGPESPSCWT